METNILKALSNIAKIESFKLTEIYSGKNRMNNVGTASEYFIKAKLISVVKQFENTGYI